MKKQINAHPRTTQISETLKEKLESGAVPLKEMVSLYDKGMNLYAQCDRELKDFEERLKKLEQEA